MSVWIVFLGVWKETNEIKGLISAPECVYSMYMQNFRLGRGLTFANLWFCGSSRAKFFLRKFWGRGILKLSARGKSEQSARVFSAKIVFFINSPSFLPPKFPLYGIASSS